MSDPFAHLKENRRREVAEIDDRLERGEKLLSFGFRPPGEARRLHPTKQGTEYRIVWLDA